MKQKWRSKRLLALALLLASVLGLVWASQIAGESQALPDTDSTSQQSQYATTSHLTLNDDRNWPLYEDVNYGFEIRYPPDWFIYPSNQPGGGDVATIANHPLNKVTMPTSADFVKVEIGVFLYDKSPTQSLKEWAKPPEECIGECNLIAS